MVNQCYYCSQIFENHKILTDHLITHSRVYSEQQELKIEETPVVEETSMIEDGKTRDMPRKYQSKLDLLQEEIDRLAETLNQLDADSN